MLKFWLFIIYTCLIFFVSNKFIGLFIIINLICIIRKRKYIRSILVSTMRIFPFILFTFIINVWLDSFINALYVGLKLLIVCNITIVYSKDKNISDIALIICKLCKPLKFFNISTLDIKVLVYVTLSMIVIIKKDLNEINEVCKVKGIKLNIRNIKIILLRIISSLLIRVNNIDEALIVKGYR